MDWQAEFRYLGTAHTLPSRDDLWNSLRTGGIDKHHAAGLAELFYIAFERICQLESAAADLLRAQALQRSEPR